MNTRRPCFEDAERRNGYGHLPIKRENLLKDTGTKDSKDLVCVCRGFPSGLRNRNNSGLANTAVVVPKPSKSRANPPQGCFSGKELQDP